MALTQISPSIIDSSNNFTMTNLAVTGNVSVSGNIVGNVSAAQPNITSVGTLTGLTVTGQASFQLTSDIVQLKTGATGVVTHDVALGALFYHTNPAANFTVNFTNVPVTNNRGTMVSLVVIQGATPYVPTAAQIEGAAYTLKWMGGNVPTGNANKVDVFSFSLLRVSNSWTVLSQLTNYA